MKSETVYTHPSPNLRKIEQAILVVLLILMGASAIALVVLAFVLGAPLFAIMALMLILLCAPVLMRIINTPPVRVRDDGLVLELVIGGERFIAWEAIHEWRDYPLLPTAEQESGRRLLVGRAKYTAPKGIMLVIPSLPLPYRIGGYLTRTGGLPIVTFTNRTHTDYDLLVATIAQHRPIVMNEGSHP